MKKLMVIFLLMLSVMSFAQEHKIPGTGSQGTLEGGFGMTWIDGAPAYAFRARPDVSFGKFGLGLDINLEFTADGKIRTENFNTTSDYLALIRYLRYGSKNDDVYVQVGSIDDYTLGHGSIMYYYSNSASLDNKKIGLAFDLNMDKWGVESIYSDFSEKGIAAVRGYVKPLQFTSANSIPIISNIEVGASYAADMNTYAGVYSGTTDPVTKKFKAISDKGNIKIMGADIGLPIFKGSVASLNLYFDYTKIVDFGDGKSAGMLFALNGMGIVNASLKFERRDNSAHYISQYFSGLYEIERFKFDSGVVKSGVSRLNAVKEAKGGYFGSLLVDVAHLINAYGSYQRLDADPNSGTLRLQAEAAPTQVPMVARAGFDKSNIRGEKDMFVLDDRSSMYAELGYKPYSYLLVSMVYQWTFTPVRDNNDPKGNVIGFKPQKRVEPRVTFVYPFGGK